LVTRKRNGKEYVIDIDWKDFEEGMLEDIPVSIRARTPVTFPGKEHGTRIEVSALNELPWTRRRVRTLHRAVTSICSPLGGFGRFRATLRMKPRFDWLEGLLTAKEVLDLSVFRFKATVEGRGMKYQYSFEPPLGPLRGSRRLLALGLSHQLVVAGEGGVLVLGQLDLPGADLDEPRIAGGAEERTRIVRHSKPPSPR
jgi:hypothetical protein